MNDRLPQVPPLRAGDVQLWFFPLGGQEALLPRDYALLDSTERSRADAFCFARDRNAFIRSHAMMRRLLARHHGGSAEAVAIVQPTGEKPRLADDAGLHFSLSHSGSTGLLGIAAMPLGVDIEAVRPLPDRDDIARRFFADGEVHDLERLHEADRHQAFFACWTRKEAYVKAIGLGLAAPLDAFRVSIDPLTPCLLAIDADDDAAAWTMWSMRAQKTWAAAAIRIPNPRFLVFRAGIAT